MNNNTVAPIYEAKEYEHCYLFRFNMPGFSKEKSKVQIVDNELAVSIFGTGSDDLKTNFVFSRGIEAEQAKAIYAHGVLRILVPKKEYSKQVQVQIDDEKSNSLIDRILHPDDWGRYLDGPEVEHVSIVLADTGSTNYSRASAIAHDTGLECM